MFALHEDHDHLYANSEYEPFNTTTLYVLPIGIIAFCIFINIPFFLHRRQIRRRPIIRL